MDIEGRKINDSTYLPVAFGNIETANRSIQKMIAKIIVIITVTITICN